MNRDRRPAWKKKDSRSFRKRNTAITPLEVVVINNDVAAALKVLKNKMSKDGVLTEMKERRYYEKPSAKKRREYLESLKKARRAQNRRKKAAGKKKARKKKNNNNKTKEQSK